MSVIAILQARTSSTRLPNKVLLPILNKAMLVHQIERVKRSKKIDKLVVATSLDSSDDQLERLCTEIDVDCFRGSLSDVLDRFYQTAISYNPQHIVRLTGDCPLTDHYIIDDVINHHLMTEADYTSNFTPPSFPDGIDVEVIKFSVLEHAWKNAVLKSEREHVTPFIRREDQTFKLENLKNNEDLSELRWTVDEPEDFNFVEIVYKELYEDNKDFLMNDILCLLNSKPELNNINSGFIRNEGYLKSLDEDKK